MKRGRKSIADLATPRSNGSAKHLHPPAYLNDAERRLFSETVAACDPRHFVASDLPVLVSYVQATLFTRSAARDAASDPAKAALWEKAVKLQLALAVKLRLTPLNRTRPHTVARRMAGYASSAYDEMRLANGEDA